MPFFICFSSYEKYQDYQSRLIQYARHLTYCEPVFLLPIFGVFLFVLQPPYINKEGLGLEKIVKTRKYLYSTLIFPGRRALQEAEVRV